MQELLTPLHTPKLGLVAEALSDPKAGDSGSNNRRAGC